VNRFVADFIGETNILRGRAEGGRVRLLSGDVLAVPSVAGLGDGADVTLAVRPEQVRISPAGAAGQIGATLTDTVYFGTDTHCHLRLRDGTEVVARLQSLPSGDIGLRIGDELALSFVEGALQVLEQ